MRSTIVALAAIAAAGCTTTPAPAPEPDNTPVHPTALIETHVSSNGLKGMFPFETSERRFLVNMFGPSEDAVIARLDRDLRWTLDLRKRQYTECPLKGCSKPDKPEPSAQAAQERKQPEAKREPGCVMRVAKKRFTVTPTGQKQDINGFPAAEYRVAWIVTLRDNKGRESTSSLSIDTWTTPLTPAMREALHLEQVYDRAYSRSMHERARARARDRSEPLPPEVGKAILGYMGQLGASDRAALLGVGRELARIKGHPVRTRVDWDLEGNACAQSESGGTGQPESSKSFMSGLTSMFSSKKDTRQKSAGEPLFSLTFEIKALGMENVHDGVFAVPKGYQRVNG
jgi:hypothetical protein